MHDQERVVCDSLELDSNELVLEGECSSLSWASQRHSGCTRLDDLLHRPGAETFDLTQVVPILISPTDDEANAERSQLLGAAVIGAKSEWICWRTAEMVDGHAGVGRDDEKLLHHPLVAGLVTKGDPQSPLTLVVPLLQPAAETGEILPLGQVRDGRDLSDFGHEGRRSPSRPECEGGEEETDQRHDDMAAPRLEMVVGGRRSRSTQERGQSDAGHRKEERLGVDHEAVILNGAEKPGQVAAEEGSPEVWRGQGDGDQRQPQDGDVHRFASSSEDVGAAKREHCRDGPTFEEELPPQ